MDWKTYSFVVRAKYRKNAVIALKIEKIPTQIAKAANINISHVSRALAELKKENVVECINPEDGIGKVYRLTKKGKEIRDHMMG